MSFLRCLLSGLRHARNRFQFEKSLQALSRISSTRATGFNVAGDYLISTDKGIFRLTEDRLDKVCPVPAFGISAREKSVFLATWTEHESVILKGDLEALLRPGVPYGFERMYTVPIAHSGMRIHQIALGPQGLWLANTARNTLTKLDPETGAWKAELAPITCQFGSVICADHNHVNSVAAYRNVLLFVAFRAGQAALVGACGNGMIRGFSFPNMGAHDIHLRGERFLLCDSYRFNEQKEGGCLVMDWEPFDLNFFDSSPQPFVRGVAGHREELIIGNSFAGSREERFLGEGNLLVASGESVLHQAPIPAAQVYDIIRTDGAHFDEPPAWTDFDTICEKLGSGLGEPVLECSIEEAMVSEAGKKYDERDWGSVPELMPAPG